MPARSGYQPGVPCWADLSSPDPRASAAFYEEIFGWRAGFDPDPEAGGYGTFRQDGKLVAGVGPTFGPGRPPAWNTYIATGDAESVAGRVKEAGGRVSTGPVQVFDEGSMAVFEDPAGAVFMVWEPGRHFGAQLVGEPVSMCWSALDTRDPEDAKAFYPAVFGWAGRGVPGGGHTEWLVDGRPVAAMTPTGGELPGGARARWLVHFAVRDCDAVVALAAERGATALQRPRDLPPGRSAVLADPFGAVFAVTALRPAG
ncbi:VOC family protein [Sphaerisporangium album]|uniref:VOC family protein n=1 Tax=Sphaerisporangium album TaxID=509200 RepID=A0A367FJ50_9ACTN|nr:VOC family protein [Sphaerisporangium album]RCG29665.1 VOC family protein [Sphaerisporangium album]